MKIAFFGTGDFSKNILEKILEYKNIQVELIVSQPDKPIGRKKEITHTPVKKTAIKNNIDILQPITLKNNNDFFDKLNNLNLDFIVVVAYGKIVPSEVLNAAKYGCINIHGSLLPKYRGASPIQESIKSGDKKTGITIMYMTEGMDEGDILKTKEVDIEKYDMTQDIFYKFEKIAPDLLVDTLENIVKNNITQKKQNEKIASYCSKITKKDGIIDWEKESAKQIFNKFKAYKTWPGVYSYFKNKKINIEEADYKEIDYNNSLKLGDVIKTENKNGEKNKQIGVVTTNGLLIIKKVKLEGKKEMDINTFINGNKDFLEYNFLNKG